MSDPEMPEEPATLEDIMHMLSLLNITSARLYDVQMAHLTLINPEAAKMLDEAHSAGKIIGAPPMLADDPFS